MGRSVSIALALAFAMTGIALGQDNGKADESSYESTTITTTSSTERYIRSPVFFDDAVPQPTGTMDFHLRWEYETSTDREDETGIGMQWEWGPCENVEVSLDMPVSLGDGGKVYGNLDGNADLTFGMQYRFWKEGQHADWMPAFAFGTKLRMPTGDSSNGVDAEFRTMFTKTLGGRCRGHVNAFATTVNGDNEPDARNFQWGFVFGVDAPLTAGDKLWLLVDYMHRSSERDFSANMNMAEVGIEWKIVDTQSFHFTTQIGLDDNEDTPNWGAEIAYTYELRY